MAKKTTKKAAKKAKKVMKRVSKKATKKTTQKAVKKTTKKTAVKAKKSPAKKAVAGPTPQIGAKVPAFALPGTGGHNLDLGQAPGKKIVLYFYPKDDTPGCTLEGQDFNRLYKEFQDLGAEVYGVSRDTLASHDRFCGKMGFVFPLLSDSDEKACQVFGVVKDKNMYGKMVRGIERSTFLLDEQGVLRQEWRKVQVDGHAQAVLDAVKSLA